MCVSLFLSCVSVRTDVAFLAVSQGDPEGIEDHARGTRLTGDGEGNDEGNAGHGNAQVKSQMGVTHSPPPLTFATITFDRSERRLR